MDFYLLRPELGEKALSNWLNLPQTQIFYEAPHRLVATLQGISECFGEREGAVVRELTKLHQQVHKGTVFELKEAFELTPPRGECCIVIAPYVPVKPVGGPEEWCQEVTEGISRGLSKKDAMKEVAKRYGVRKPESLPSSPGSYGQIGSKEIPSEGVKKKASKAFQVEFFRWICQSKAFLYVISLELNSFRLVSQTRFLPWQSHIHGRRFCHEKVDYRLHYHKIHKQAHTF